MYIHLYKVTREH